MTYTLELTEQQLSVIGNALGQMPYRTVAQLVADLDRQVQEQAKAKAEAAPSKKSAPKKSTSGAA